MQENNKKIHFNTKHGLRHHRMCATWKQMIQRCTNPKSTSYKNYGDRGITVCERWRSLRNFIEDMYPSFIEGLTLDRIDTNGNYEKTNCTWSNKTTQQRNQRKIRINNKSGYRGVSWNARANKWVAQTRVNNEKIYLGYFTDKINAAKAYDNYIIINNLEHTKNF